MRRLALVWVCSALAVVGCSKPDQPGTLPPKPSASPSPSPSVSAQPKDPKAAIVALVKRYYAEANRAISTGNTATWRALITPDCRCLTATKNVETAWKSGSIKATNYYAVRSVTFGFFRSHDVAFVNVIYGLNQEIYLDSKGKQIANYPAALGPHSSFVECRLVDGTWKVADLVRT